MTSTVDEILKLSNNIEIREKLTVALRAAEQRNTELEKCVKKMNELRNEVQLGNVVLDRERFIELFDDILKYL